MKLLKITIPAFFIISLSVITYFYFSKLPQAMQQMAPFLPHFIGLTLIVVALYFNTAKLFYLGIVVLVAWLGNQGGFDFLPKELLFILGCCIILVMSLLPERGFYTWAAWPVHLISLSLIGLSVGLAARQPEWLQPILNTNWFSSSFLAINGQPQVAILLWVLLFLGLSIGLILKQQRATFNGLITLLALWLLFASTDGTTALLAASSGLLILLLSALQNAWHLAYVDELTALPGRRALEEKLQRSLGIYALAMADVDHFKKFNDNYGHDVGDDVLRMIAAKIGAVGGGGHAYRYGGEEFTIVFNNHSADEIKPYLQELIKAVADTPFVINRRKEQKPKPVKVTISIGVTDSIGKSNATETIKVADQALYMAKKKGRNRLQTKK